MIGNEDIISLLESVKWFGKIVHYGVATGKCGFTTLRKLPY